MRAGCKLPRRAVPHRTVFEGELSSAGRLLGLSAPAGNAERDRQQENSEETARGTVTSRLEGKGSPELGKKPGGPNKEGCT